MAVSYSALAGGKGLDGGIAGVCAITALFY
jgi:hypothetical protein